MGNRIVYGNSFSSNGWPMVDEGSCTWVDVPGTDPTVRIQIQNGQPLAILRAFVADINAYVEHVRDTDTACWTAGNSVSTSNHLSGTAVDIDWDSHPFQISDAGWNPDQINTIRQILDFYEGTVFWGNDWSDPKDAMHFQLASLANGGDIDTCGNPHTQDFINRKIRSDGFSTFRRDTVTPPPAPPVSNAADVLAQATGLDLGRATEILPTMSQGLNAADCTNPNRIAMFLAQTGEESAGFDTTEEYASGAEYEGRTDLGNTQPGDGVRFKGRTWIQITGRNHYAEFSQWAFGKGFVSSPTEFIDNPSSLGDLKWAGIGAAWYWTVSRPDINALSDAGDVVTVTHRINGGENGLADRQNRYARAHTLGDQLLSLITNATEDDMAQVPQDQWDRVYQELTKKFPSRSPLRHLGEGVVDTMAGFILNTDGSEHVEICRLLAGYGHPPTLALLREVAGADPQQYPDRQDDAKIAQAILADVTQAPASFAPVDPAPAPVSAPAPQVVYVDRPTQPAAVGGSTGAILGRAYDSLEELLGTGELDDAGKGAANALISALQTKIGATK